MDILVLFCERQRRPFYLRHTHSNSVFWISLVDGRLARGILLDIWACRRDYFYVTNSMSLWLYLFLCHELNESLIIFISMSRTQWVSDYIYSYVTNSMSLWACRRERERQSFLLRHTHSNSVCLISWVDGRLARGISSETMVLFRERQRQPFFFCYTHSNPVFLISLVCGYHWKFGLIFGREKDSIFFLGLTHSNSVFLISLVECRLVRGISSEFKGFFGERQRKPFL